MGEHLLATVKSICRNCPALCGMELTVEDGMIRKVRGDPDNEATQGYACFKVLQAIDQHHGPERLRNALKRGRDRIHRPIASAQAIEEIAARLGTIIDRHGPDAFAIYHGSGAFMCGTMIPMSGSFLASLGSKSLFTPITIDQPNKMVSMGRLGVWRAGNHDLEQSDVLLLMGTNPLVSHQAGNALRADPARRLKAAKARGLKLICIDPRRTETARHADLFVQPVPGQDPAILGGLIRLNLAEGWEDGDFCAAHVGTDRIAALRAAVDPLTPDVVEARAGLPAGQLRAVAEMFARDHRRGAATMTTGGSFAPFADLTQHLLDVINVICGRLKRAGDYRSLSVIAPPNPFREQVTPPTRPWEAHPPSRIRGAGNFFGEKLAATLAEEILEPGPGQVKALICVGGNPANVVPDHARITRAMHSLELSVTLDPWFTTTAQNSDYVIAPKMMYERADISLALGESIVTHNSHVQYTPAVIDPPAGSDVIDDWYFFWAVAARLGRQITYAGAPLDMATAPTGDELLAMRMAHSRVSFDELRRHPGGRPFEHDDTIVQPADPACTARFDVMPADVAQEMRDFLAIPSSPGRYTSSGREFGFVLTSRRSLHITNSTLNQLSEVRKRLRFTPAFLHPDDMAAIGVAEGGRIGIESDHGRIVAEAFADADMRRSVVSILHGVASPADDGGDQPGVGVNALIDSTVPISAITAQPRMSAIPVEISTVNMGE